MIDSEDNPSYNTNKIGNVHITYIVARSRNHCCSGKAKIHFFVFPHYHLKGSSCCVQCEKKWRYEHQLINMPQLQLWHESCAWAYAISHKLQNISTEDLPNTFWRSVGSLSLRGVSICFQTIFLNRYLCATRRLLYFDPLICCPIRCDAYVENCRRVSYNVPGIHLKWKLPMQKFDTNIIFYVFSAGDNRSEYGGLI